MIDDAMKGNRMIGMIQPKSFNQKTPDLYKIGCVGKITSFNERRWKVFNCFSGCK